MRSRCFFLLSRYLIFDSLYFLSLEKSYSIDTDSNELGYDSISYGTYSLCYFSLHFEDFVSSVSVLGYDVFAPTGVKSKEDIFFV